jgi:glycosyltransferase involved in cell wall biosynthesis
MGPVAARSFGVDIARGNFVLFLDSDDELVENWYDILFNSIVMHNNFDLYAFPDISSNLREHSSLNSLEEYWGWSAIKNRPSDFMLCIRRSVLKSSPLPKFRISELWFIYSIFKNGYRGIYLSYPLFIYHHDSGNQLSKLRRFKLLLSDYDRKSVSYSLNSFSYNSKLLKKLNPFIYNSWQRRLLKESFLSFHFFSFLKLFYIKIYDTLP